MESNNNKIPDIVFIYPETFPDSIIEEETSEIRLKNIDLRIIKNENNLFAGFEWIIPTAFGAYLLKPYFDSFLSEVGKDHYNLVKASFKTLIKKGKIFETKTIAAHHSSDKLSKNYTQSLTVSIEFQTINNRRVKLLFDNKLNIDDWNNALEEFMNFISENYDNFPNDRLTEEIDKLDSKEHKIIYVIINPETKKIQFKDDRKMLESYK